ncbi:MAG: dephospho-CoA kinase [Coriobacteriia bacterium]|jgi:dephospho-CoA kinase|nr:dephospho-CoA kinase [Coriobacteriia bacterium]
MYVIALTGGIGAGKTTAAEVFRARGAVVLSLDDIAKRHLAPGMPVHDQIVAEFGAGVLEDGGTIDRRKLAATVFSSPERARRLNAIVHPAILREVGPGLRDMGLLLNPPRVVVLDVPLLVEAPVFGELAERVLAISAPENLRIGRAVEAGMDEADVRARIRCQATDAQREEMADEVIRNEGSLTEFQEALERYWDEVIADAPQ